MKMKKKDWVIGVGICVLVLVAVLPETALGVPGVINYQGYLTDAEGNPINGDVGINFWIWSAEVGGTQLWFESHASVAVSKGVFNVLLGSSMPIGVGILEGDRWMEMAVGPSGGTPYLMIPRMKITSVAYAIRAGYAESVAAGSVDTTALSDTAVTEAKIASGAVTGGKLGSGSVTSDKVAFGAVSTEKIASGAVTGAKVAAGTLTATHLQNGAALAEILDNDGPGSGLNADLLDGQHSSAFSLTGHNHDAAYVNVTGGSMTATSSGSVLSVTNTGLGAGVLGLAVNTGVAGSATAASGRGVAGDATGASGIGVRGLATNEGDVTNFGGYFGAAGKSGIGVYAYASGSEGWGVRGLALGTTGRGVYASATNDGDGTNYGGYFRAYSTTGRGVYGYASNGGDYQNYGVYGEASGTTGRGVAGEATGPSGIGVRGLASNTGDVTNYGGSFSANGTTGIGIYARGGSSGKAAVFRGNVEIKRESDGTTIMELGAGLDYAEGFQVTDRRELGPGSVLIIDPKNPGKLALSTAPYDSKVAGIVSGANGLGSGVRLGTGQFDHDVALAGRVYCNVDATGEGVEPGDLLTTSDVPGHAMKATNHERARGAILGKAMEKLEKGTSGQILVLVTLQ